MPSPGTVRPLRATLRPNPNERSEYVVWMTGAITDLADSGVLAPVTLAVAAYLWWTDHKRLSGAWMTAAGSCVVLVASCKLWFLMHSAHRPFSPSGHTALAINFCGALALLLGLGEDRGRRAALLIGAAVASAAVAWSRLALLTHTPAEVAGGVLLGGFGLGLFVLLGGRRAEPCRDRRALCAVILLTTIFFYGNQIDSTGLLTALAVHIGGVPSVLDHP